jgi:hypothetical protein
MKLISSLVLLFLSSQLAAQTIADTNNTVIVNYDARLNTITKSQKQIGKDIIAENEKKPKTVTIYRIQVLSTTDRNAANAMKLKMYNSFPGYPVVIQTKPPYYNVQMGEFATELDAKKARPSVAKASGTTTYIVTGVTLSKPSLKPKTEKTDKDKK